MRRSVLGVVLLLMSSLMIIMQVAEDAHLHPRRTPEYALFWTQSFHLDRDRYPGKYLPFLVFPVEQERLISVRLLEEALALTKREHRVVFMPHTTQITPLHYSHRSVRRHIDAKGRKLIPLNPALDNP